MKRSIFKIVATIEAILIYIIAIYVIILEGFSLSTLVLSIPLIGALFLIYIAYS